MKIIFLSRLFYPHIGGVEKHVLETGKLFIAQGHKITVITEQFDKKLPLHESHEGIEIVRMPVGSDNFAKKFMIWKWMLRNRELIKQADVIHCHDVFFWYLPLRFLFLKKKVFTTFHGYEGNTIPGRKAIFMHKVAELLSRGNICVGDYLKKWYGTSPTFVTYGGVTIPDPLTQTSFSGNKIKCVFVGRLVEETGFLSYLKGIKIASDQGYPLEVLVLGDGDLRKEAQEYCKASGIRVVFKGFVPEPEKYLSQAHFVLTSRYLGILEAFAYKKFVFAQYNSPIKQDYLELAPFAKDIAIFKNEHEFAQELLFYLHNIKLIREKSDEAYSWVKKQTWDDMVNAYLSLWVKK